MKIILPDEVSEIIGILIKNGYEAYAVGGCVRDSIIHRVPGDWDITTSANPYQVKTLFRRTIDTGIDHGTVTVMIGKNGYEVTTFRIDGEYEDSRHPNSVEFTSSLIEDLQRRDFTINAMAYNEERGIVDEFQGEQDLKSGIIRCVGDPEERFQEDALRMLRAVRFSAQLGFTIEEKTAQAILKLSYLINKISKERIHTELNKILVSEHPEYIEQACLLGLTKETFSVFDKIEDKKIGLEFVCFVPKEIGFKYAALLYSAGENRVYKMLKELKLDNHTVNQAVMLTKYLNVYIEWDQVTIRKFACIIGKDELIQVLKFKELFYKVIKDTKMVTHIQNLQKLFQTIIDNNDCIKIADLAVNGRDLINIGIQPGIEMGTMLKHLLDIVLENPQMNTKETLLEIAKNQ